MNMLPGSVVSSGVSLTECCGRCSVFLIDGEAASGGGLGIRSCEFCVILLETGAIKAAVWATALETIGLFTNQAWKAGQGNEEILRFFAAISSLFAIKEGSPVVPDTAEDETQLIAEVKQINEQYHVLDMLRAISVIIEHDIDSIPDKRGYYILQLNYEKRLLRRWFFKPSELEQANRLYDMLEEKRGDAPLDIVLVRASSYGTVRAAYPNYFMDIGELIDLVSEYLR